MKSVRTFAVAAGVILALSAGAFLGSHVGWGQTQPAAAKARVPSEVIDVAKLATRSTGVGNRRDLFDAPTVTLANMEGHISVLNAGEESHPPHQHGNEEMVILMEGQLEVYINGKVTKADKGAVLYFSSYDWHNVRNTGTVPAMYYVLNWKTAATPTTPPAGTPATAPARIPG